MDRFTILKPARCDLRQLPLDRAEAFVLSQLDGQLTLGEIATIAGLDVVEAARLARRLLELGAATLIPAKDPSPRRGAKITALVEKDGRATRPDPRAEDARVVRLDPRAERLSWSGANEGRGARGGESSSPLEREVSLRPDPRAESAPSRPNKKTPSRAIEARRPTRKSLRAQRAVKPCGLDEPTQASIALLDKKLEKADLYAALEIERDADKKAIKRAYFALAARFHPDRFFGKELGALGAPIARIYERATSAYDTLSNPATRSAYDAALPPVPRRTRTPAPASLRSSKSMAAAPRKASKAMRVSRRSLAAMRKETPARLSKPKMERAVTSPEERPRQLHQAVKEMKLQARVEMLLQAAEEALRADDVIGAANNYRLALEHRDDPEVRAKLDKVDDRAKLLRFTRSVTQGRAAEVDQRWADAATHYVRAWTVRPSAEIGERAGYAILMSRGDLTQAAKLLEEVVRLEPNRVSAHVTLGEVFLAANRLVQAEDACDAALKLASSDARAKSLAGALAKKKAKQGRLS